jgi:MYXO-CTERM domain-containing protein
MTEPDSTHAEPGPEASIDDLQADIEETRADLGDTARALTDKLDVKARAGDAVSDAKHRVVESATTPDGTVKPALPVTAVAVALLILGIVVWRRRRR